MSALSRKILAEHLESHVAAQVGVAALEHGAHAAAGDLAVDAVAERGIGIVPARGPDDRPGLLARPGVAEQDAGDVADRGGDRVQDARTCRQKRRCHRCGRNSVRRRPARHARGSEDRGYAGRRGQLGTANRAGRAFGHRQDLQSRGSFLVVSFPLVGNWPRKLTPPADSSSVTARGRRTGRESRTRRRRRRGRRAWR